MALQASHPWDANAFISKFFERCARNALDYMDIGRRQRGDPFFGIVFPDERCVEGRVADSGELLQRRRHGQWILKRVLVVYLQYSFGEGAARRLFIGLQRVFPEC